MATNWNFLYKDIVRGGGVDPHLTKRNLDYTKSDLLSELNTRIGRNRQTAISSCVIIGG